MEPVAPVLAPVLNVIVCGGCKNPIGNEQWLRCCICAQVYDLLCANVPVATYSTMAIDRKEKWVCLECKCKQPRRDNSNTPVRSTRLEAGSIHCDDQNMNVTIRKTQLSQNRNSTEQLCDEYMHPDETYLDNLRVVIQEEFKHAINERLANMISNVVAKQVDLIVKKNFSDLNDQIIRLEKQLHLITSRSMSDSTNCKQITGNLDASSDVHVCKNKIPVALKATTSAPAAALDQHRITYKPRTARFLDSSIAPVPTLEKNVSKSPINNQPLLFSSTQLTQVEETRKNMVDLETSAIKAQDQHDSSDHCQNEWVEVTKKRLIKSHRDVVRGSATTSLTRLEAAERVRYIHLYYVKIGTTEEQVLDHLQSIVNSEEYTVEGLKARGNYASFKLGVPSRLENCIMSSEHWPENICMKPWRQNFRNKSSKSFQEQKTN